MNEHWLDGYAAYKVLKGINNNLPWFQWDDDYKSYNRRVIDRALQDEIEKIEIIKIIQYFSINNGIH